MQSLIAVIATLFLFVALPYLIAYWKTLQLTFCLFRSELASDDQMPEHLKTFFKPIVAELESCGFQVAEYRLFEQTVDDKKWGMWLQHTSWQTYVSCSVRQPFNPTTPSLSTFFSFMEDGRLLATVNVKSYGIYSRNPRDIAQYLEAVPIVEQWQAHQRQLELVSQTTVSHSLSLEAFIALWKEHQQKDIERLVQNKEVYWVTPGETYRMTWWTTAQSLFKIARARGRKPQPPQPQASVVPDSMPTRDATIALEVEQFYQWQQTRKGLSPKKKLWLFLGTLALFVAVYASRFDPQRLVIFVAVLLFHEGGHVLAMKCFGYRDTTMLFVPFLGALATGRKQNASLTEKVWISLAGPLPGLILGIGLAIAFNTYSADITSISHPIREASKILIDLNLFNLLPIYPLDGGQVADLLLFSGNSYLGVVFKGIGVLLLGLLGLGIHQTILVVFAVLIGISIPQSFRLAQLNTTLRQEMRQIPSEASDQLVRFLFGKLQDSPNNLPLVQKSILVQGLLESYRINSVKWTTRFGLSGIYVVSLLAGIVGGLYSFLPNWYLLTTALNLALHSPTDYKQQMKQAIERADRRLKANPKDVEAYMLRHNMRLGLKDYQGALADANQIIQLDHNSSEGYILRREVRLRLGDNKGAVADAKQVKNLQNQKLTRQLQQLARTLSRNPKDVSTYLARASLHLQLKYYTRAIADCNQVLRLEPHNVDALSYRGNANLLMKNYNQAISDANQILSIQPNSMEAYTLRGEARRQVGDATGANADDKRVSVLEQLQDKDQ